MKFRGTAAIGIIALTSLALSACGSDSNDDGDGGSDGGTVELTFQSLSDQPGAIAATEEIVNQWNADNPDIQVEIVPAGWDGVYDKLVAQFNGGSAPDIIHYEAASIIPFAKDGYIADLTDLLGDDLKSDISEGIWESVTVDDQIIAVPTELQSYMVFANKTLLDAAGVTIPMGDTMTWNEFQEIAKATTTGDVHGVGWGLKNPTATFMNLALGFDGTFFEGTGTDATLTVGEGEMAVPERVYEMAFTDASIEPISLTQSGSEVLASFYGGKVAMTVQGSFQAANIAKDAPEGFEWVTLPPLEGTASAAQAANPQTLSVNIDSEHVEEAAEFIGYVASADNMARLNMADALIPASTSARAAIAEETGGADGWDQTLASGEFLTSAPFLTVDTYTQWKETVATPAYQKFLAQQIDSEQLATELTDGWDQINR
jgi:multiple sugar transport system substrate-binding protein